MSKCYALQHIGMGAKRYKPGDPIEGLSDSQWKRLTRIGAIRTEIDPEEIELDEGGEENAQTSAHLNADKDGRNAASGEPAEEPEEETGEEDEGDIQMPDIDGMDGIAQPQDAPKGKKSRKAAK